jgi:hypothetical protein
MPYKQSQTSSRVVTTRTTKGNVSVSSFQTTAKRKLTRGETAGGLLTTIGQLQMIGITIVVLSVGTAVGKFDIDDLIVTTPNYQVNNEYVPINDPLNTVDYITYGEDVFDKFFDIDTGFIAVLNDYANTANTFITYITNPFNFLRNNDAIRDDQLENPTTNSFVDEFGVERFNEIEFLRTLNYNPYQLYEELTTLERTHIQNYLGSLMPIEQSIFVDYTPTKFYPFGFTNPITGLWQWGFYTYPSVYTFITELGV